MNAQQLRNSILQEAIEGRLVPQDLNDEPASALLQRMAVQSFKRPVRQWNPNDAPVQGKRFVAYQQIGLHILGLLETDE